MFYKLVSKCPHAFRQFSPLRTNSFRHLSVLTKKSEFCSTCSPSGSKFSQHNTLQQRSFSNKVENDSSNKSSNEDQDGKYDDSNDVQLSLPLLMDFIPHGMPNLWYSMKNFYMINFVLRTQIDKNFDFKEFINGAKLAFTTVTTYLANNQLDKLDGLVEPKAIKEIKQNLGKMTVAQQQELELHPSDVILAFAHHISIETLKEEFTGTNKHIVYFFVVFDCIRNLEEILKEKSAVRASARDIFSEFKEKKYVCNYEFKREYIEGAPSSDWIISKLLHIKEKDLFTLQLQK